MTRQAAPQYYLYINGTQSRDLLVAIITASGQVSLSRQVAEGTRTERLLPSLARVLRAHRGRLRGVVVAQGSGSFSQTRLACTVANTLAYACGVPLTSVPEVRSLVQVAAGLRSAVWRALLYPVYCGPAVGS